MMLIFIVLVSCLLHTLSSGQMNATIGPMLGPVLSDQQNDSVLDFTIIYPTNPQYTMLVSNFTLYDFVDSNKVNPQLWPSDKYNCTNINSCYNSTITPGVLRPGDFVIGCFQWGLFDSNGQTLGTTYDCALGQTTVNLTKGATVDLITSSPLVTNSTININAYYPAQLPYDQVSISSTLGGTMLPTLSVSYSNTTYMSINTFTYVNLTSNTQYTMCIYVNYSNSVIQHSQKTKTQCQNITTFGGVTNIGGGANIGIKPSSSNRIISILTVIILLYRFIFI